MSRLIDADRLLDKCKFYHLPNGDLAVPIVDVLHAPSIDPEPQWFSGLPEEEGFYVVCLDKNNLLENEISVLTALWHDNQWKFDCIEIFVTDKRMPRLTYISFDELQVIKWMPLTGLQHKGELH